MRQISVGSECAHEGHFFLAPQSQVSAPVVAKAALGAPAAEPKDKPARFTLPCKNLEHKLTVSHTNCDLCFFFFKSFPHFEQTASCLAAATHLRFFVAVRAPPIACFYVLFTKISSRTVRLPSAKKTSKRAK